MLPHHHHEVQVEEESVANNKGENNFLGFLKSMFYQDIGEGHLEHFDLNNDQIFADQIAIICLPAPHIFSALLVKSLPTSIKIIPPQYDDPLPERPFTFIPDLRGPPSYS